MTLSGVERLEVQPRRRVEVGRNRLRVRVDHDRRAPQPAERVGRLDRAVVELDPLADPDRPGADDHRRRTHDGRSLGRRAGRGVGRVEVRASRRRTRRPRCRPSRNPAAGRAGLACSRTIVCGETGQRRDVAIAEAGPLGADEQLVGELPAGRAQLMLEGRSAARARTRTTARCRSRAGSDSPDDSAPQQRDQPPQP